MEENMTLIELLRKDLNDPIRQAYNANAKGKKITRVKIGRNVIRGYSAFSFIEEKTFVTPPERSSSGAMTDIQDIPTFVTPHLKIDFSLLFIEDYRKLMNLIYEQNEYVVQCYDIVKDKQVEHRMYFATEQMPKIYAIARELQGVSDPVVELLGVQDYTVELIGTNNTVDEITVVYNVNVPSGASWSLPTTSVAVNYYQNEDVILGEEAIIKNANTEYLISALTFDNKYKFEYWCTTPNPTDKDFKYTNGDIYRLGENKTLYAIWKESAK